MDARILLPIFLISTIFQGSAKGCFLAPTIHVYVNSYLPQGTPKLRVHCSSKNDDLGYHTLATGENFNWTFCENVFRNTLFHCHLWWGKKEKEFVAFKSNWHLFRKNKFSWLARGEGIYCSSESSDTYIKKYDWDFHP